MRTSLSHRCARFLDARDMLRRAFPFAHAQMIPICAGMAAGQDRPWDAGRLYACRDLIQEETGLFSNFRGAGHLAVITLLALSPAPEERMAFALQGYKVLRTRFYASQYLPLAALLLADWARGRDLDGVAARAEEIYRRMKREHPFLTGAEDSVFAVLLALPPDTEQAVVDQVEACYDALKHPFGTGQYTQALSHVLALGEGSAQEKRDKVLGVYQGLKAAGRKYGAGYELGTLGSLALLPAPVEELTADVLEVDEFLSHQKGYRGILGLPKNQRLMHSAMLVSGDYVDQRKTSVMGAAAVSGTVAMIAAQEMALCAVMVGGIGASAAANNDG